MELTQDLGDNSKSPDECQSSINLDETESSKSALCVIEGDKAISSCIKLSTKKAISNRHMPQRSFSSLLCSCFSKNNISHGGIVKNNRNNKFGVRSLTKENRNTISSSQIISQTSESHNTTQQAGSNESEVEDAIKSPFSRLWYLISHSKRSIKTEDINELMPSSSSNTDKVGSIALIEADALKPLARNICLETETVKQDLKTNKGRQVTLLGVPRLLDQDKKCFIIDLDETLVHSSFKAIDKADFRVGVEIDNTVHQVYVLKRPYVDEFLKAMSNIYECVLFTASLAKYADPVADFLDKWNVFRYRLFRESCVYHRGNYVKDLAQLGRSIDQVVILDNSPASYMFHATHAVQITSWFDDKADRALLELIPYFQRLAKQPNVVEFLRNNPPPQAYACVGSFDATNLNSVAVASSRSQQNNIGPITRLLKSSPTTPIHDTPTSAMAAAAPSIFSTSELPTAGNPISSCVRLPSAELTSKHTISTPAALSVENKNTSRAQSSS